MSRGLLRRSARCRARQSVTVALACWFLSSGADARRGGIAVNGCEGCHTGGASPTVKLSTDPDVILPGASVTTSVAIQAVNGSTAGLYLSTNVGKFSLVSGQSTTLISDTAVSHSAPKSATGGEVVFRVQWTAPSQPGGVVFEAWALSANGDGNARGDGEGSGQLSAAFGCPGTPYYIDFDGDGFGEIGGPVFMSCIQAPGYADVASDCNDGDARVFPGAPERCNKRDDSCDGRADEDLATGTITLYRDVDGDGYGTAQGMTMSVQGCVELAGYSPVIGDCNDANRAVHPGAADICNLLDDNCDGMIDENSRPTCGEGGCRRVSPTCDPADCVPKRAIAEVCNAADEDCDGVVDNGENLCPAGRTCRTGFCFASDNGTQGGAGGSAPSANGGVQAGAASVGGATGTPSNGAAGGGIAGASDAGKSKASGCSVPSPSGRIASPLGNDTIPWLTGSCLWALSVLRRRSRTRLCTAKQL